MENKGRYLQKDFVLQVLWTGQVLFRSLERMQEQIISQNVPQDLGHFHLLIRFTVNLE